MSENVVEVFLPSQLKTFKKKFAELVGREMSTEEIEALQAYALQALIYWFNEVPSGYGWTRDFMKRREGEVYFNRSLIYALGSVLMQNADSISSKKRTRVFGLPQTLFIDLAKSLDIPKPLVTAKKRGMFPLFFMDRGAAPWQERLSIVSPLVLTIRNGLKHDLGEKIVKILKGESSKAFPDDDETRYILRPLEVAKSLDANFTRNHLQPKAKSMEYGHLSKLSLFDFGRVKMENAKFEVIVSRSGRVCDYLESILLLRSETPHLYVLVAGREQEQIETCEKELEHFDPAPALLKVGSSIVGNSRWVITGETQEDSVKLSILHASFARLRGSGVPTRETRVVGPAKETKAVKQEHVVKEKVYSYSVNHYNSMDEFKENAEKDIGGLDNLRNVLEPLYEGGVSRPRELNDFLTTLETFKSARVRRTSGFSPPKTTPIADSWKERF